MVRQKDALFTAGLILSSVRCRVWNTLTDNYGNVMAVDWKTSHTRSLHLPILNLSEQEVPLSCRPRSCVRGGVVGSADRVPRDLFV